MNLGDIVIQTLGEGTTHTKEDIISAIRESNILYKIPGLGRLFANVHFYSGLTLEEQSNAHPTNAIVRGIELVRFAKQPDGKYSVHKEFSLAPNY